MPDSTVHARPPHTGAHDAWHLAGRRRPALPLRSTAHTIELSDGDLVLLCTGRFHAVEKFEGGDRLSGQCWLSYKRGSPLRIWV